MNMISAISMVIKNNEFVVQQIVLKVSAGYSQKSSLTRFKWSLQPKKFILQKCNLGTLQQDLLIFFLSQTIFFLQFPSLVFGCHSCDKKMCSFYSGKPKTKGKRFDEREKIKRSCSRVPKLHFRKEEILGWRLLLI